MERYHPAASLAPRDVVARAIDAEMKIRGDPFVLLDLSELDAEKARARFPNIFRVCAERGIQLPEEPIPVVPAAHYQCGGLLTDWDGRTSLAGLYAAGSRRIWRRWAGRPGRSGNTCLTCGRRARIRLRSRSGCAT